MIPSADPAAILEALVRCRSVTPSDDGALRTLEGFLQPLGFTVERPVFSQQGAADVENLYARLPGDGPHLMFAGHTDVVPAGDEAAWSHPPFGGEIGEGRLYGRGAVDMKGGIACFVAAVARRLAQRRGGEAISLLITGDEEGPALNGTVRLLEWAARRGERWDAAIVGEPTSRAAIGDMVKIGRRGSLSGRITVFGRQGHAAYPHLAENPVRGMVALAGALLSPAFDDGSADFQPSNLEITTIDVGNGAANVIPASATALFNIRFNDLWTDEALKAEIMRRLGNAAKDSVFRPGRCEPIAFDVSWNERTSPVFLTRDDRLVAVISEAVRAVTGRTPELSTSGGTSDARFVKDYCPVVEFGLVGQTMHMVDENVPLADLETLTDIYTRFLADWFA